MPIKAKLIVYTIELDQLVEIEIAYTLNTKEIREKIITDFKETLEDLLKHNGLKFNK